MLARTRPLRIERTLAEKPTQALALIVGPVEAYLPLAGMVDLVAERDRLGREQTSLTEEIERAERKLANTEFVGKAPAAVVEKERERLSAHRDRLARLQERRSRLEQELKEGYRVMAKEDRLTAERNLAAGKETFK